MVFPATMSDPRYPGFVAIQRHCIDGYGLQRLRKDATQVIVVAGPDVPLVELLVCLAHEPWSDRECFDEQGWYFVERTGDQWDIWLEGGKGTFAVAHATLLRICEVIRALELGNTPEIGEALDADGWDRRFGWAKESGLLESRVEHLNELARRYVELLKKEGVVPGSGASAPLLAARGEIVAALDAEGLTNRAQPDAIFYQLRDRGATFLSVVFDALDMQHDGALDGVSLDWWILEPAYPRNGSMGAVQFVQHCHRAFIQAQPRDLDPILVEVAGKRMLLLPGWYGGRLEMRTAIMEETFVEDWVRRAREIWADKGGTLAPVLDAEGLSDIAKDWHLPMLLRVFLERIGNGGRVQYLTYLSLEEILRENDRAAWLRPCPLEICTAQESVDWERDAFPDGLLCISGYYYNASRMYLLADGRVTWATPTENGYSFDPPHFWMWT